LLFSLERHKVFLRPQSGGVRKNLWRKTAKHFKKRSF